MTVIRLEGFERAAAVLAELPRKIGGPPIAKSVRAGARPLVAGGRRGAPVRLGHLRRSINLRLRTYRHRGLTLAIIGPTDRKYADGSNPGKYGHLVEGGTAPHVIPGPVALATAAGPRVVRNIRHPGSRPTHFLAQAARQAESQSIERFRAKLEQEVLKIAR